MSGALGRVINLITSAWGSPARLHRRYAASAFKSSVTLALSDALPCGLEYTDFPYFFLPLFPCPGKSASNKAAKASINSSWVKHLRILYGEVLSLGWI